MIEYLKRGLAEAERIEEKNSVKDVVSHALSEIENGGDAAVRSMSEKFDNYSPASFRLNNDEIQSLMAKLSQQEMADVKFAQTQVRNFAMAQRESMRDIEVEPLPGVILGHKNIPVQSVGCYVPGGKFPMVASAHMSVVTADVAGVPRIVAMTCLLYTSPSPRDKRQSRMPSSA